MTNVFYYAFIVVNIGMQTLEIVRLALLDFGIGLLPVIYVGLLLGAGLHWTRGAAGHIRWWVAVNAILWGGGVIMSVVKCVALRKEKERFGGRRDSKYPVADQLLDIAVMAGVYAVIGALEALLAVRRSRDGGRQAVKLTSQSGSGLE